jgi:hypothetical protein
MTLHNVNAIEQCAGLRCVLTATRMTDS